MGTCQIRLFSVVNRLGKYGVSINQSKSNGRLRSILTSDVLFLNLFYVFQNFIVDRLRCSNDGVNFCM